MNISDYFREKNVTAYVLGGLLGLALIVIVVLLVYIIYTCRKPKGK